MDLTIVSEYCPNPKLWQAKPGVLEIDGKKQAFATNGHYMLWTDDPETVGKYEDYSQAAISSINSILKTKSQAGFLATISGDKFKNLAERYCKAQIVECEDCEGMGRVMAHCLGDVVCAGHEVDCCGCDGKGKLEHHTNAYFLNSHLFNGLYIDEIASLMPSGLQLEIFDYSNKRTGKEKDVIAKMNAFQVFFLSEKFNFCIMGMRHAELEILSAAKFNLHDLIDLPCVLSAK